MYFRDRKSAAYELTKKIKTKFGSQPLVLAIPRSGFIVGSALAAELGADLDALLIEKLWTPGRFREIVGAVSEFGHIWSDPAANKDSFSYQDLMRLATPALENLQRLRSRYTPLRAMTNPHGRDVVIVDDGIISGATALAALHSVKQCSPNRIAFVTAIAPIAVRPQIEEVCELYLSLKEVGEIQEISNYFESGQETVSDAEITARLQSPPLATSEPLELAH